MKFGIGQAVRRKEDQAFITGAGRYIADIPAKNALQAYVLRSPYAHATFKIGDLSVALAMPGVAAILTYEDIKDLKYLPCKAGVKNGDGSEVPVPPYYVLAKDTVKHVGDAVAFVLAETLEQARDAAEAIEVDYKPLPAAIGIEGAMAKGAAPVWDHAKDNVAFDTGMGDAAKTEAAFAKAARVIRLDVVNNRLVTNFMETRGALCDYDAKRDTYTLYVGSQGSHSIRDILCESILKIDPAKMRVVTPDVGGGFGTKIFTFREYALVAVAARKLGRPVRWISERAEHFMADTQGRDNVSTGELAFDAKNRIIGMRVDLKADMGAYLSQYGPFIPWIGATMTPGLYDIPAVHIRIRGIFTNTVPVDAYRGAGRPEAAYLVERLVDHAARELGMTPEALRKKNFVKSSAMPHKTATDRVYDSGEFAGHLEKAQEIADWKGFPARLKAARKRGKIRGIGFGCYIEACGGGGAEYAKVTLAKDGTVTVLSGAQSTGQGHLTAYAQIVSQQLDIPMERIKVEQGDTRDIKWGTGTGGSRSIPVGGASVAGATEKLVDALKKLASDALETSAQDLEFADGQVRIVGTDRAISLAELASSPAAKPAMLAHEDEWTPPEATYPNGTHLCEVEIDPETGVTEIVNYLCVDDFGVTLNPLMLAGQVHGGVGQGIGQALMERTVYDRDSGQLVSASFMDYAVPRASDLPAINFQTRNVPCVTNKLGVKGAGEAGAIGACPAVMNAVADALYRAYGATKVDMPATPEVIWRIAQAAKAAA